MGKATGLKFCKLIKQPSGYFLRFFVLKNIFCALHNKRNPLIPYLAIWNGLHKKEKILTIPTIQRLPYFFFQTNLETGLLATAYF